MRLKTVSEISTITTLKSVGPCRWTVLFFDTCALVGIGVGRGALGEKDMSLVRTTEMLYNAKVRQTDSEQVAAGVG